MAHSRKVEYTPPMQIPSLNTAMSYSQELNTVIDPVCSALLVDPKWKPVNKGGIIRLIPTNLPVASGRKSQEFTWVTTVYNTVFICMSYNHTRPSISLTPPRPIASSGPPSILAHVPLNNINVIAIQIQSFSTRLTTFPSNSP